MSKVKKQNSIPVPVPIPVIDEKIINEKTIIDKFKSETIQTPYINTTLVCPVMLQPTQMDNKLYLHLKTNLVNKLVGKCYQNYGHIIKIYKIEETSEGIIEAEDSSCSAKYIVKFSCKLCLPAKNKEIICKIDRINKALISGINGPIKAIITPEAINKEKFFTDGERNFRIKSNSKILEQNIYIKVLILQSTFRTNDIDIIAMAFLQDIATPEEIKIYENEMSDLNEINEIQNY
jgi:DNA-directed RNA polymerase subunit E'/Rpb7